MSTVHEQLCETAQYIVCHMAMVIYSILLMFNGFQIRFFLQRDLSNKIKEFYERTKSIWILLKSLFIDYVLLSYCKDVGQNILLVWFVSISWFEKKKFWWITNYTFPKEILNLDRLQGESNKWSRWIFKGVGIHQVLQNILQYDWDFFQSYVLGSIPKVLTFSSL